MNLYGLCAGIFVCGIQFLKKLWQNDVVGIENNNDIIYLELRQIVYGKLKGF